MKSRFIDVFWAETPSELYTSGLHIFGNSDKNDLLNLVTTCSQKNVKIDSVDTVEHDTHNDYRLVVRVSDKEALRLLMLELERLPFVDRVEREIA